jgi:hypothetical protein
VCVDEEEWRLVIRTLNVSARTTLHLGSAAADGTNMGLEGKS